MTGPVHTKYLVSARTRDRGWLGAHSRDLLFTLSQSYQTWNTLPGDSPFMSESSTKRGFVMMSTFAPTWRDKGNSGGWQGMTHTNIIWIMRLHCHQRLRVEHSPGQINIQRRDNWNVGKVLSKNCDRQTHIQRNKYFIKTHIKLFIFTHNVHLVIWFFVWMNVWLTMYDVSCFS